MQSSSPSSQDSLTALIRAFLESQLSLVLILLSIVIGAAALWITPREEDPQIVVPLADVYVQFPGHSAAEVEQLVASPLERLLYQIDGVEYVYSMSRDDAAWITVRFYVGQDRERSLVKLFKKLNENQDLVPAGVASWTMKPVEIDDVPVVTLALKSPTSDSHKLRRIGEELLERLAVVPQVSRAAVIGGESRQFQVCLDPDRLNAYGIGIDHATRAIGAANQASSSLLVTQLDRNAAVVVTPNVQDAQDVEKLVIGIYEGRPVFLKDVADIIDGAEEVKSYVRQGWGPAASFAEPHGYEVGKVLGSAHDSEVKTAHEEGSKNAMGPAPAVMLAISKQKGANAVAVATRVLEEAERLRHEVVPDDVEMIVTRNSGAVANEKVNELIEALGVAIIIVVLLLTFGLGWREAIIVSIAVPVVFGLTLAVNLLFGYTINRVTLFALILALGLLVDDPIVDVENIARHFEHRKRATRSIVLAAVSEIRPPLISATLAVIVSFLPMFFITGMMGPYMSPMALNVPVAMGMSMLVAFTITPWLSYHVLTWGRKFELQDAVEPEPATGGDHHEAYDPKVVQQTFLYRTFKPLMLPLMKTRGRAILFLLGMGGLTMVAMGLGALRMVPLKMLPFDNKNELLVLVTAPEGTSLERTDAMVRDLEGVVAEQAEVVQWTTAVGIAGPIDFNGMVRHYYWRGQPHQAEVRLQLVGKKERKLQSHGIGLRMRPELDRLSEKHGCLIQVVELPPGPPVLASLVAEVYADENKSYGELLDAARVVASRMQKEPGILEVDDVLESPVERWSFVPDQEKAMLSGVSVDTIRQNLEAAVGGASATFVRVPHERNPLRILVQLPRALRTNPDSLGQLGFSTPSGGHVLLRELGTWKQERVGQSIYHKNLKRVAYVFAESIGRTPAECIIDVLADQQPTGGATHRLEDRAPRDLASRTFLSNGSGIGWGLASGFNVTFAGEGEWKITLDVFRDLGLAFGAAMLMIYIILVAQTGSFVVPMIVMLAIPLTALGVMPGFYALSEILGQDIAGYQDPVYFTATAMIGMIALSGIVTRDSIILVDFMQQAVAGGRPLMDAILESRVVRLRPILLTAGAALLSAIPITLDPIFSGLGWSLIFGLIASTLFTLFVIPVTYWLVYHNTSPTQDPS